MHYTDLVFDLYGTLVDIHTDENDLVWEKTALYFGFYGAQCTGSELKTAFLQEMQRREIQAGQNYECFRDIHFLAYIFRKNLYKRKKFWEAASKGFFTCTLVSPLCVYIIIQISSFYKME